MRFMKSHKCYDIVPTSSKLVVFDTALQVSTVVAKYALHLPVGLPTGKCLCVVEVTSLKKKKSKRHIHLELMFNGISRMVGEIIINLLNSKPEEV